MNWRHIETAPKDDSKIIAWNAESASVVLAKWSGNMWRTMAGDGMWGL